MKTRFRRCAPMLAQLRTSARHAKQRLILTSLRGKSCHFLREFLLVAYHRTGRVPGGDMSMEMSLFVLSCVASRYIH
eukprot:g48957.t1